MNEKDGRVYEVSLAALFARLHECSLSTRFACHRNHHNARFRLRCSSSWIQRNDVCRKVPCAAIAQCFTRSLACYICSPLTCSSFYVRWIEASGARVVAIPWDVTPEQLQWYASRVNAVLFPGGGLEDGATMSAYFLNVMLWHDTSIAMSKRGESLVLWGTCQGFQVLCAAAARNLSVIEENVVHGLYPSMLPLNLTSSKSRRCCSR